MLGLVVIMIVLWNTRYMPHALGHLEKERSVLAQDIQRLSPVLA